MDPTRARIKAALLSQPQVVPRRDHTASFAVRDGACVPNWVTVGWTAIDTTKLSRKQKSEEKKTQTARAAAALGDGARKFCADSAQSMRGECALFGMKAVFFSIMSMCTTRFPEAFK